MHINRIFLCFLSFTLFFCGCQRADATTGAEPLADVYFLGDSTTAHMAARSEISAERILATRERYLNLDSRITYAKIVAPDTGKEEKISTAVGRLRPRFLVVTLGVDYGVYYYRNELETFIKYYDKLLDELTAASPETTLLLQSIFPVAATCRNVTNEMIDNANACVREIAKRRGLLYLDTQAVLRDEEGFLKKEFSNSEDGIHLTSEAYSAILSHITEKLREAEVAS